MFTISLTGPDLDFEDPVDAIKAFIALAQDAQPLGLLFEVVGHQPGEFSVAMLKLPEEA